MDIINQRVTKSLHKSDMPMDELVQWTGDQGRVPGVTSCELRVKNG